MMVFLFVVSASMLATVHSLSLNSLQSSSMLHRKFASLLDLIFVHKLSEKAVSQDPTLHHVQAQMEEQL